MSNQRQQLLLTQATTSVLAALGAGTIFGDNIGTGPEQQRGVILRYADLEESVIHSETYWMEGSGPRFRYRVVARLSVERNEVSSAPA